MIDPTESPNSSEGASTPPTPAPAPLGETAKPPAPPPAAPAQPVPAEPPPPAPYDAGSDKTGSLMSAELDREVAEAFAAMSEEELGAVVGTSPSAPLGTAPEKILPGTEMIGTIVHVSEDDIMLEFGPRVQGVVPHAHFGKKEPLEVGRRVDVVVEGFDADSGLLKLARKGRAQAVSWTTLQPGMLVEGRVTGLNKGGLEVDLKGIRAFMPASQVDLNPLKDISILLNDVIRAEVLEIDRKGKNVLISRRRVLEKDRAESREKTLAELEAGQVRRGVVTNLADFGAFVDLGGIDGLVHISDMSWSPVAKVTDIVSIGQEVEVKILKIDTEKKKTRISLGMKQAQPDPWTGVAARYPVGTSLKAKVLRLLDFGAFAELEPGIDGLIPVSEMGWGHVKKPGDVVKVGEVVDVAVIRVEPDKRRIALSIKQASPDPWSGVMESFSPESQVTGTVTRLADFGAFVELAPGVEGLIHISQLSDKHVRTVGDVLKAGQEISARVLAVDPQSRRISLTLKSESAPAPAAQEAAEQPQPEKKRKKALRGGLATQWEFFS